MKKSVIFIIGLVLLTALSGCNNTELTKLQEENEILKEQLLEKEKKSTKINKYPDRINLTISWIGGSLSREISVSGFSVWGQDTEYPETTPINSKDSGYEYIRTYFNRGGYALVAGCNEGYKITNCKQFGNNDSVEFSNDLGSCWLYNEDPNLLRTSMKIECSKK
ncbi:MAG TPA: hypothetical protein VJ892_03585 [Candidatus Absconditabacterales bacterium]|nr:hypothetical protein [Candidatus Absconditabacterales bacterium]